MTASPESMRRFIESLRHIVIEEANATQRQITQEWVKPLARRVADGRAVEGVRFVGLGHEGHLRFECDHNTSRFREGDTLHLSRGNPFFQPSANVTLEEEDETDLLISLSERGFDIKQLSDQPTGWVLDEGYMDLSHYALDALAAAGDTLNGRQRILPLLMGYAEPQVDMSRLARGEEIAASYNLNAEQIEAFAQGYAADRVWLVQGPPGTGKTRVLAQLARVLAEDGERVFITAFTHRAINNALNTLTKLSPLTPAIKIGERTRGSDLHEAENFEYFNQSSLATMKGGYVIGATPFAPCTNRLGGVEFETVIFDEASQITLPLAIMGMLPAKKYIFFGDHKQLPPVLTTRFSGGAFRDSVFGALADRGFDTMLTRTYRLHAKLAEWPSEKFYEGRLTPTADAATRLVEYLASPPRFADVLDPTHPKVFLDLQHRNNTTRSHLEASTVVDLIMSLVEIGFPMNEIGVVVPYRAQARAIKSILREQLRDPDLRRALVIDTVERMQGQERDLIIVSLTTSNPTFAAELAEFFFQPERLNVAITRPRSKLIIVGSSHVLCAEPTEPEQQECVDLLRDLINSCAYRTLQ
ncbi:MAG: AAA family ATPase [Chloroflexi bacterium]|nr:AAA family ATPase [Chloroflexota bacterium]